MKRAESQRMPKSPTKRPSQASKVDVGAILQSGLKHHQAGRLTEAEHAYLAILKVQPDQPDALHLLGVIAHDRGDHAKAEDLIGRAIGLNDSSALFFNNLGEAQRAQNKFDEEMASFRRAIAIAPSLAIAHNNLALLFDDQGSLAEADDGYRRALDADPEFKEALYNLSNLLLRLGLRGELIEFYHRVVAIDPGFAAVHNNLGNALRDERRLDEAAASYRRSIEINELLVAAHCNLASSSRIWVSGSRHARAMSVPSHSIPTMICRSLVSLTSLVIYAIGRSSMR